MVSYFLIPKAIVESLLSRHHSDVLCPLDPQPVGRQQVLCLVQPLGKLSGELINIFHQSKWHVLKDKIIKPLICKTNNFLNRQKVKEGSRPGLHHGIDKNTLTLERGESTHGKHTVLCVFLFYTLAIFFFLLW
jgi:hypothetical protein